MRTTRPTTCMLLTGLCLCAVSLVCQADQPGSELSAAELQQAFLKAGQAYDDGRTADAVAQYESLLARGYTAPEVYYNLGNSYYRGGQTGLAVLNYRRAWHHAPRDPDVRANLGFAVASTGALAPALSATTRLLQEFSLPEWIAAATIAYWLGAFLLCLARVAPRGRDLLRRALVVAAIALVVSLAGVGHWVALVRTPEAVVLKRGQQALFAPLKGSTAHFEAPEGSILRIEETSGPWLKVAAGRKVGWMHESACGVVSAWQGP